MWKVFGGIGAAVVLVYGLSQMVAFETGLASPEVKARVPLDIERIYEGPAADRSLPDGQILPWDRSEVESWIATKIAELDPLVTDDAHRAMAQDLSINTVRRNRGYYLTATYEASEILNYGEPEDDNAAIYILLHAAQASDPVALHNLGYLFESKGGAPKSVIDALYRSAGDLDFQPSLVNLLANWAEDSTIDTKLHETYLRYALDLNAEGGGWFITEQVANFYIYDHPEIASDGYLDRALERMRDQYGNTIGYHQNQGFRFSEGIGVPVDEAKALKEYLASVAAGGTWAHNRIGYRYMKGLGTEYNKDLARDHFLECLEVDPNDSCAMNLGSLYQTPSRDSVDYPVAYAFYRFGADMGGSNRSRLEGEIRYVLSEMNAAETTLAYEYAEQVARGDLSNIPHIKDARPVTP